MSNPLKSLHFGKFRFDCNSRQLYAEQREIRISDAEAALLAVLIDARGALVSSAELQDTVGGASQKLYDVVCRLNKKIIRAAGRTDRRELEKSGIIGSVRNRGYQFLPQVEERTTPGKTEHQGLSEAATVPTADGTSGQTKLATAPKATPSPEIAHNPDESDLRDTSPRDHINAAGQIVVNSRPPVSHETALVQTEDSPPTRVLEAKGRFQYWLIRFHKKLKVGFLASVFGLAVVAWFFLNREVIRSLDYDLEDKSIAETGPVDKAVAEVVPWFDTMGWRRGGVFNPESTGVSEVRGTKMDSHSGSASLEIQLSLTPTTRSGETAVDWVSFDVLGRKDSRGRPLENEPRAVTEISAWVRFKNDLPINPRHPPLIRLFMIDNNHKHFYGCSRNVEGTAWVALVQKVTMTAEEKKGCRGLSIDEAFDSRIVRRIGLRIEDNPENPEPVHYAGSCYLDDVIVKYKSSPASWLGTMIWWKHVLVMLGALASVYEL